MFCRKHSPSTSAPSITNPRRHHPTTHLVKPSSDINRTGLDDSVDDLGKRGQEVGRVDLGVEKDFRGKESFVTDIHVVSLKEMSTKPSAQS